MLNHLISVDSAIETSQRFDNFESLNTFLMELDI